MIQKSIKYILILFLLQINATWANCPLLLFGNKVEPKPMTYKEDGNISIFMVNFSGESIINDDGNGNPACELAFKLNNLVLKNNDMLSITSEDSDGNDIVADYFDVEYNTTTSTVLLKQKEDIPTDIGFTFKVAVDVIGQSLLSNRQNGFNLSLNGATPAFNTYTYTSEIPLEVKNDENVMIDGDIGGIAISDITANDTINHVAVTLGGDVSIVDVNNTTPLVIDSTTGSVVVNAGTLGGIYHASYRLCETYDSTHCADANITVHVQNHAPIANNDTINIAEDTRVNIEVLANDTDADEDTLKILSVVQPLHGIIAINIDNTAIQYRPDNSYNGSDSFTYIISDGNGGTDEGTVTIDINGTNVAPNASNDYYNTNEDNPITVAVLENDIDTDGDSISIVSMTQPTHGSVALEGTDFVYTPLPNYNGEDIFTYTITDGMDHNDSAVVTMQVNSVNDLPQAIEDNITTIQNTSIEIKVLKNDLDIESNLFRIVLVTAPQYGRVNVEENGTVTYEHNFDYSGIDSFTYVMADEDNATDMAEVNIIVIANVAPQTNDDNVTAAIGDDVTIEVLENDRDEDNATDISSIQIIGADEKGMLNVAGEGVWQVSASGEITFRPKESFVGDPKSIEYTVADDLGNRSKPAKVTINYIQENPQTIEDRIAAMQGVTVVVKVLENDTDDQGDINASTLRIIDMENNATVETLYMLNEGTWKVDTYGTITFVPEEDLVESPSPIYYVVSDNKGHISKQAKVVIDYPVIEPTITPTPCPTPIVTPIPTITPIPTPSVKPTVTPTPQVRPIKKVKIVKTVEPKLVPTVCQIDANNDLDVVITSKSGTVIGILYNDSCLKKCGTLSFTQGLHGKVSVDDGGTPSNMLDDVLIYVPDADNNDATDSFEYTITDCQGHSATATVSLTIHFAKKRSSNGDAMGSVSMILMLLLSSMIGLLYLRKEEIYS